MARYIDADKLIETVKNISIRLIAGRVIPKEFFIKSLEDLRKTVLVEIVNAPTADVVEVVHGEWIGVGSNFYSLIVECSECGTKYDFTPPHCPNCGTKMNGKKVE